MDKNEKEMSVSELMDILKEAPSDCIVKIIKEPLVVAVISDELGYNITGARYTRLHRKNGMRDVLQIIW
jgi:hypothetical protein